MNISLARLKSLTATTKESSQVLTELTRAASKASAQSSSTLFGVAGGLVGMAAAYGLSFIAPISLVVLSPLFAMLGIVIGILVNRGPSRLEYERTLDENRLAAAEIMGRINALPRNTPQDVRDKLWATYKDLNSMTAIASYKQRALPLPITPVAVLGSPGRAKQLLPMQSADTDAEPIIQRDA